MDGLQWDLAGKLNVLTTSNAYPPLNGAASTEDNPYLRGDGSETKDQTENDGLPLKFESFLFHSNDCACAGCVQAAEPGATKGQSNDPLVTSHVAKLERTIKDLQRAAEHRKSSKPSRSHRDAYRYRSDSGSSLASSASSDIDSPEVDETPDGLDGPKLDIKRFKKTHRDYGEPRVEKDHDVGVVEAPTKNLDKGYVLTVFREFDRSKNFWRRNLEILSPSFVEVLRGECEYDIDVSVVEDVLRLTEPLMILFHNRKQLTAFVQSHNDDEPALKQAVDHTRLVLGYMRDEWAGVSKKLDDLKSAKPSGLITFPDIWLLYAPGTVVYITENGEHEAFVVDSVHGVQKRQRNRSGRYSYGMLELKCWSIDYDGEIFGRVWTSHCLAPFDGVKEIACLDIVPERFVTNIITVKESLKARGKNFWALQGQNYREYSGEVWSQQMSEESTRVMVDHLTYQRRNDWPITINRKKGPSTAVSKSWKDDRFSYNHHHDDIIDCRLPYGRNKRPARPPPVQYVNYEENEDYSSTHEARFENPYWSKRCDQPANRPDSKFGKYDILQPGSEPDELTMLLCPQNVQGYCLRDKVWKALNVTKLKPVAFRTNAWERLVLDEEYKDIVQAMVSSYVDKTARMDDLVAGKGSGLVCLLHGPPGTGKTLTAECVAESFEKPLYQVTCGDIGTDPARIEEKLEEIFDYAVTWGAILLLDESDIFLQDRDYDNLQRNALVSIFLRTLEYFTGILFLTTNRVGSFDQAFQSRIHVTLGLPVLDRPRRQKVWTLFLNDLGPHQNTNTPLLLQAVSDSWSKEPLNGRQIRNCIRTALVLAETKAEVVGEEHFERVLRIGREFESYLGLLAKGEGEGKGKRMGELEGFTEVVGL